MQKKATGSFHNFQTSLGLLNASVTESVNVGITPEAPNKQTVKEHTSQVH